MFLYVIGSLYNTCFSNPSKSKTRSLNITNASNNICHTIIGFSKKKNIVIVHLENVTIHYYKVNNINKQYLPMVCYYTGHQDKNIFIFVFSDILVYVTGKQLILLYVHPSSCHDIVFLFFHILAIIKFI